MSGKVFYAMNIFGIGHFSLFVTDVQKYIFIHAAFINKIEVSVKLSIKKKLAT